MTRPHCPACGAPCEDDGDRWYHDRCLECGWRSEQRIKQDIENTRRAAQWAKEFSQEQPTSAAKTAIRMTSRQTTTTALP